MPSSSRSSLNPSSFQNDFYSTLSQSITYSGTSTVYSPDLSLPSLISINDSESIYSSISESSIDYDSTYFIQQSLIFPFPLHMIPDNLRLNLSPLISELSEISFRREVFHVFTPLRTEYFIHYTYLIILNPSPISNIQFSFSPVYFYPDREP